MRSSSQPSRRSWVSTKWAQRNLRAVQKHPKSTEIPKLLDWAAEKFPELERFDYFAPYADAFERAVRGEPLRLAFAAPPQHGKSLFTLIALLWIATFFHGLRHAYVTYNETRAESVAKDFRKLAARAGINASGTLEQVDFPGGTSVLFTSVKGGITGYPIDGVCVIDDPIKGAKEARSPTIRADAVRWYQTEARTRRHKGTSYIAMATRWHIDDLPGYLVREQGFQYLNLKAIAEPANDNDVAPDGTVKSDPIGRKVGESLCPLRKPPEFFEEEQRDKPTWYAMYQGEPRPIGGEVFKQPAVWTKLPATYRVGYGVDLAYTSKTSANFSVCVQGLMTYEPVFADGKPVLLKDGKTQRVAKRLYITDVQRKQVDAPAFTLTLFTKWRAKPGPMRWYCSTSEKGSAQFVKQKVPVFDFKLASTDKYQRALPVSAAWNDAQVLVPGRPTDPNDPSVGEDWQEPEWLADFVDEITSFTGVNDVQDDQVDALAALWDVLAVAGAPAGAPSGGGGGAGGGSRWDGSEGRGF